jgi:hypothetical protein
VTRYREEVFNIIIAQLLHRRGVVAAPEQILSHDISSSARAMPDVIVQYNGLRTIIEGRFAKTKAAQAALLKKTRERVQKGIGHLGIAIIYPDYFRSISFDQLPTEMATYHYQFAIVSEIEDVQLAISMLDFPEPEEIYLPAKWFSGDLDGLGDLLRRTYDRLLKEDVVKRAADNIRTGIANFSTIIQSSSGSIERCADALGIRPSDGANKKDSDEG